jgi:hypothetical protein
MEGVDVGDGLAEHEGVDLVRGRAATSRWNVFSWTSIAGDIGSIGSGAGSRFMFRAWGGGKALPLARGTARPFWYVGAVATTADVSCRGHGIGQLGDWQMIGAFRVGIPLLSLIMSAWAAWYFDHVRPRVNPRFAGFVGIGVSGLTLGRAFDNNILLPGLSLTICIALIAGFALYWVVQRSWPDEEHDGSEPDLS